MGIATASTIRKGIFTGLLLLLTACGGGGGGSSNAGGPAEPAPPAPTPVPAPEPEPEPAPQALTETEAARFLSQATFGPGSDDIEQLMNQGLEEWFLDQLNKPASLHLDKVLAGFPETGFRDEDNNLIPGLIYLPSNSVWQTMIEGEDQLRQRMAFALSQILVVSANSNVGQLPQALAHYADILTAGALGNYRDLLEEVTYSPAMSIYLTYLRNQKADPQTGRVPDENYARELLQLFTVGLVALNPDGTPQLDGQGQQIELFDNDDITELAKVFTGLSPAGAAFNFPIRGLPVEAFNTPLEGFEAFHSLEPKQFLDVSIPANTGPEESIDQALDGIFAHPNVGPFIGRQLIQRFVTSSPEPEYVQRVAAAFDAGRYSLPSGTEVGDGQRGDMRAVIAAVLFDEQARDAEPREESTFGKLREPVLRFTHWARAFEIANVDPSNEVLLRNTSGAETLGQHPYVSPSVFNFYRPGYIAPGTETGAAGLTAPELQITNATSIVGYPNFITVYALGLAGKVDRDTPTFAPNYSAESAVANDIEALIDLLDAKLTHGTLRDDTRERITDILAMLEGESAEGRELRAQVASVLVMTSPEYVVLR